MLPINSFDSIRPFHDTEVHAAILSILDEPMLKTIMQFAFPNQTEAEWKAQLKTVHSTQDFQARFVSKIIRRILETSSQALTTSGFETLSPDAAYLYISNHRDIFLDTSLINLTLFEHGLRLTASAIGDNLVRHPFLNKIAKINRNFLVLRGLTPRELLQSSIVMSKYIHHLLMEQHRPVWLAQREGRTKDGKDATHAGVLKMLSMAAGKMDLLTYFKQLKVVPIAISYEYDPTDILKIPELLAQARQEKYIKGEKDDFNAIITGITGQKKRIHIATCTDFNAELDTLKDITNPNQFIKSLTQVIDNQIISNYKLWPSNYIAADLQTDSEQYAPFYSVAEKTYFVERMQKRIDRDNPAIVAPFLEMYANPVHRNAPKLACSTIGYSPK